jgi:allantoate deiminase
VRFHSTYLGSHAVTGNFEQTLLGRRDADRVSLAEAMTAFGLDPARIGEAARRSRDILAYLELHIEQGPVLESADLPVGVVTSIAGATRLVVSLDGEAGHAGTVPMGMRRDALTAAAECVLAVERVCAEAPNLVGTVGQITAEPGASNVIPGFVRFTVDLRAAEDSRRASALEKLRVSFESAAKRRGLAIEIEKVHEKASVPCDTKLADIIAGAIERSGWRVQRLPSGAGHDAAAMADLTPIGMVFVRCAGGVSHNPDENITAADAEVGAQVLLQVLSDF